MENNYYLNDCLSTILESPDDDRYWFGYYNYCPIDKSGDRVLAHRWHCDGEERAFSAHDTLDIGWFSITEKTWNYIATTHAANWQQGAMSQWLNIDGEQRIIFNDAEDGKYVSKIYNIDGTLYKILPMAIYGINQTQLFSITINFERAFWCRAYHYEFIQNQEYNQNVTSVDGVYHVDIQTCITKKIIDINTVIQMDYQEEFANAKHWIEHIMLNPAGTMFSFYHRFDTGTGFRTRCFIADVSGNIVGMLANWRYTSWSHLGWIDDNKFVIFGIKRTSMGKAYSAVTLNSGKAGILLRKCYRKLVAPFVTKQIHHHLAANSHYEVYDYTGKYLGCYEKELLVNDGHPSFTKDCKYMLTDTYADENGNRNLLLYDLKKNYLHKLGRFYSPINDCGYRADLHPRFGVDEKTIIIDTAHTGKHKLMVFNINWRKIYN